MGRNTTEKKDDGEKITYLHMRGHCRYISCQCGNHQDYLCVGHQNLVKEGITAVMMKINWTVPWSGGSDKE